MSLTKKERAARDKILAFTWAAHMFTRYPDDVKFFLKFGTPNEKLIAIAETPIMMKVRGRLRNVVLPYSLNTAAGQKRAFRIFKRVEEYLKYLPNLAFNTLEDIKSEVTHRRADTQRNIHMVAEAVLSRVASEFKPEVIFAFDSLIVWIESVYGKTLGYLTIRRCLEFLEEAGYIVVREWGKRGVRSRATKIKVNLKSAPDRLTYSSACDMWLDATAHAMVKVYARESSARQDVLEAHIHHYADQLAAEMMAESRWAQGARLFPVADGKIAVVASVDVTQTGQETFDETYIDRLLGELVPALQEDFPILDRLSQEYQDKLDLVKVDADLDNNEELLRQYDVLSIPTLILLDGDRVVGKKVGQHSEVVLREWIDDALEGVL